MTALRSLLVISALAALAACGGKAGTSIPEVPVGSAPPIGGNTVGRDGISHVVIVIQENRSFDNLFMNYPGADTVTSGQTHDGKTVKLGPVAFEFPYERQSRAAGLRARLRQRPHGWVRPRRLPR